MTNVISDFLKAVFAPNKMQAAIELLREENARLRHELRRYTQLSVQQTIDPYHKSEPGYLDALKRHASHRLAGHIMQENLIDMTVVPLSDPERASSGYLPRDIPTQKLLVRLMVRLPEPIITNAPIPCEEDPDWVVEEYAHMVRSKDPPGLKRPFIHISLLKRLMDYPFHAHRAEEQVITNRVATVRFEKDGTPVVVSR